MNKSGLDNQSLFEIGNDDSHRMIRARKNLVCKSSDFWHVWPWWRHQMEAFSASLALCAGNSPVLVFCLIWAWINPWVNNREAGDLRRYRAHYDVIVMYRLQVFRLLTRLTLHVPEVIAFTQDVHLKLFLNANLKETNKQTNETKTKQKTRLSQTSISTVRSFQYFAHSKISLRLGTRQKSYRQMRFDRFWAEEEFRIDILYRYNQQPLGGTF